MAAERFGKESRIWSITKPEVNIFPISLLSSAIASEATWNLEIPLNRVDRGDRESLIFLYWEVGKKTRTVQREKE